MTVTKHIYIFVQNSNLYKLSDLYIDNNKISKSDKEISHMDLLTKGFNVLS